MTFAVLRPVQSRHQGTAGIRLRRGSAIRFLKVSQETGVLRVASSGRSAPCGGIIPDRSFPTTFSQTAALLPIAERSHLVECEPGRFGGFVVASNTVLVEDGSVIGGLALRSRSDERGRGN